MSDRYLDLARKLKKKTNKTKQTMEHENDSGTNYNRCVRYSHQRIGTGSWGFENNRMIGDHPNYSIIKIGQNTEKNRADLRWLAVTQTQM